MRHGKIIEESEPNELLRKYNKIVRLSMKNYVISLLTNNSKYITASRGCISRNLCL